MRAKSSIRVRLGASTTLILAVSLVAAAATPNSSPGGCDRPEARQFEFWIGEWVIAQRFRLADGRWHAETAWTRVTSILGGCALLEEWDGKVLFPWEGMTEPVRLEGTSLRAWDPETQRGGFTGSTHGQPVWQPFRATSRTAWASLLRSTVLPNGETVISRITFSDITPISVNWRLEVSTDQGATFSPLWTMAMRRAGPGA